MGAAGFITRAPRFQTCSSSASTSCGEPTSRRMRDPGVASVGRKEADTIALAVQELREIADAVGQGRLAEAHPAGRLLDLGQRLGQIAGENQGERGALCA